MSNIDGLPVMYFCQMCKRTAYTRREIENCGCDGASKHRDRTVFRREYAKAAIGGLLASCKGWPGPDDYAEMAKRAFGIADAMVEADLGGTKK